MAPMALQTLEYTGTTVFDRDNRHRAKSMAERALGEREYACSTACQAEHAHCAGCTVLGGGEHLHRLRDGYCYAMAVLDENTNRWVWMPFKDSCWRHFAAEQVAA